MEWEGEGPDRIAMNQTDWLRGPTGTYITAMSTPVPPDRTLDDWSADRRAAIEPFVADGTCQPITDSGEFQVGRADAAWFAAPSCEAMGGTSYVVWAFTVADGRGYYFAWHDPVNAAGFTSDASFATFEAILATALFPQ